MQANIREAYGLEKKVEAVRNCRSITKADMIHNDWQPNITVDPETYQVIANGELLICEPAKVLPMAQRYFLF
jgi:urease subunit alpha